MSAECLLKKKFKCCLDDVKLDEWDIENHFTQVHKMKKNGARNYYIACTKNGEPLTNFGPETFKRRDKKCFLCEEKFKDKWLTHLLQVVHRVREPVLTSFTTKQELCTFCEKLNPSYGMFSHMQDFHFFIENKILHLLRKPKARLMEEITEQLIIPDQSMECLICENNFKKKDSLVDHYQNHHQIALKKNLATPNS